jgi:hypothetical protein
MATPAVCTAIRISSGLTVGTGKVWIVRTSGPPVRSIAAARISVAGSAARVASVEIAATTSRAAARLVIDILVTRELRWHSDARL